jgi:acyl carrier protein
VKNEVASLLGLADGASIDPREGFAAMGMDSLMSVELRSRFQTALGLKLSSTFAFDYSNLEDVTGYLGGRLFDEGQETDRKSSPSDSRSTDTAEEISEDLNARIEEELSRLEARLDRER